MDPNLSAERTRRPRRPRWLERLGVTLVAMLVAGVRLLPLNLARLLARCAGQAVYFFCGPGFLGVRRHLRIAFGADLDEHTIRARAHAFWLHLPQSAVEAMHLSFWTPENCPRHLELVERGLLEELRAQGRGVILVSGHLGSWETGPYGLAVLGYPIRLLHNPGTVAPFFEYLKRERERSGMRVLSRLAHPWALKKELDRGAWVCLAADLDAGRRAEFVPFFGVQASSYLTPAALHHATGCPILVATTARRADGRHDLKIWRIVRREGTSRERADLLRTMGAVHEGLEEAIRTHPEQWLWIYRRWRTRPQGESQSVDGLPPRAAKSAHE